MKAAGTALVRLAVLVLLCAVSLQVYFAARVALMTRVDPRSTSFQRSEAWRLLGGSQLAGWRQPWVDYERISPHLKRAVIASEDANFADHNGVEWEAIEKAWDRNRKAEARSDKINERAARRADAALPGKVPAPRPPGLPAPAEPRLVGGSTISQQLAKNLFLGGERSLARKAQEFAITVMLEALLPKRRILEIYLNSVEWGEGVFGAEAAARHYFRVDVAALGALQAARLAVMLPAPKRFEKRPGSGYVVGRSAVVAARMGAVAPP